jgi:uncharacterized membrane protein
MLPALLLAFSSGLRTFTAPAILAWALRSGSPGVASSALWWMGGPFTAYVLTVLAIVELVGDKLPFTPSRLKPGPLVGRIVAGGLCGATVAAATGGSIVASAVVGGIAAVAGALCGYHTRRRLATRFPDFAIAVAEDLVAIGLAILAVTMV